jgi:hypothetical protein
MNNKSWKTLLYSTKVGPLIALSLGHERKITRRSSCCTPFWELFDAETAGSRWRTFRTHGFGTKCPYCGSAFQHSRPPTGHSHRRKRLVSSNGWECGWHAQQRLWWASWTVLGPYSSTIYLGNEWIKSSWRWLLEVRQCFMFQQRATCTNRIEQILSLLLLLLLHFLLSVLFGFCTVIRMYSTSYKYVQYRRSLILIGYRIHLI